MHSNQNGNVTRLSQSFNSKSLQFNGLVFERQQEPALLKFPMKFCVIGACTPILYHRDPYRSLKSQKDSYLSTIATQIMPQNGNFNVESTIKIILSCVRIEFIGISQVKSPTW